MLESFILSENGKAALVSQTQNPNGSNLPSLAFIGFGEAAVAFVSGIRSERVEIVAAAYDKKTGSACGPIRHAKLEDYQNASVAGVETSAQATAGANMIFSVVTADQAFAAAEETALTITPGTLYLDCNSCAPGTKLRSSEIINHAGGRYVDVAVMAPVHPLLHKTPLLIAGPHADAALEALGALGMNASAVPGAVGSASAIKMTRSIMIKGLEALVAECVLTGRKAGVDEIVLDSLDATFPGFDWRKRAAYMLERSLSHGVRRAAEMREVVNTVAELGLEPHISPGTAAWHQTLGSLNLKAKDIGANDYGKLADAILATPEFGGADVAIAPDASRENGA